MTARPKMPLRILGHDAYTVGWICPLEVEQVAAMEMLDEEHDSLIQPSRDTNIYNLGSINSHNIVIAGLPKVGNCSAATVVAQMKMTFPQIKYSLLVGIGGGVPVKTDHGMIRLGHVVVSEPTDIHSGALQYDHGKATTGHFERKSSLAPPPTPLLNAARQVAVQRQRMDHDPVWQNTQRIQISRRNLRRFKFPGATTDHLYRPDYEHLQVGVPCAEGGCDPKKRIERSIDDDNESFIVVHKGTIASGELLIKNAKKRDDLAREHGVLCFEMEAAGVLTDFPCMVIRGISDYCDSHKNDVWHGYAAAAAAAYARQLFFCIPFEREQDPHALNPTVQASEQRLYGISITLDDIQSLLSKAQEQNLRSICKVEESAKTFQAHDASITAMKYNLISFLKNLLLYVGLPMLLLRMLEDRLQENRRAMQDIVQSNMEIASELEDECEDASRTLDEMTTVRDLIEECEDGSVQPRIDREHRHLNARPVGPHHPHDEYTSGLEEESEYSLKASEEMAMGLDLIEEFQNCSTQTPIDEEHRHISAELIRAHKEHDEYAELKKKLPEIQQECTLLQQTVEELQTERARVDDRVAVLEEKLREAERIRLENEEKTIWQKILAWLRWLLSCGLGD